MQVGCLPNICTAFLLYYLLIFVLLLLAHECCSLFLVCNFFLNVAARKLWSCRHYCLWDRPEPFSKYILQWHYWSDWAWWSSQCWIRFLVLSWNCPPWPSWILDSWSDTKSLKGDFMYSLYMHFARAEEYCYYIRNTEWINKYMCECLSRD